MLARRATHAIGLIAPATTFNALPALAQFTGSGTAGTPTQGSQPAGPGGTDATAGGALSRQPVQPNLLQQQRRSAGRHRAWHRAPWHKPAFKLRPSATSGLASAEAPAAPQFEVAPPVRRAVTTRPTASDAIGPASKAAAAGHRRLRAEREAPPARQAVA
jgi:hypothetical protein